VMIDEETRNRKWRESHRVNDDWETPNRKFRLRGVEVDKHSEETDAIVTVHGSISGIDTDEEMRNDSGSDSMGNRHKGVSQIFGLNRNLEIKHPGLGYLVKSKTLRSQPWLRMYDWVAPDFKGKPDSVTSMFYDFEMWGFSFRHKEWHQYHVNDLEDVNYRKKSFDHLVLNKDYKDILKAMVAHHVYKVETRFKDLVAGKGQGLVILLHGLIPWILVLSFLTLFLGPPGVGKTLTAECIADLYERPLYSVTSGDIGVDPDVVEKKLLEIFDYAITWNAVLLLDEADVFLAERSLEDLTRNALVSGTLAFSLEWHILTYHTTVFLRNLGKPCVN